MNIEKVIQELINKLKELNLWFSNKNDLTYGIAPNYYNLNAYGDMTADTKKEVYNEIINNIGDGAIDLTDAINKFINDARYNNQLVDVELIKTKYKNKNLEESIKRRLNEENKKSANLISDMFQARDFDADSSYGKIIIRTSNLFNALSDSGYDVQVAFDNGESTNSILLGQQGGQVIITINDDTAKLRAFISGNYEITADNIKILTDILNKIETI